MAYFLGKGMDANMDDLFPDIGQNKAGCLQRCKEQLALDPGFDYQGCVDGCGGMRVQPGEMQSSGDVGFPGEPPFEPVTEPGIETPTTEEPSSDWIDNLMSGLFGKGFETVRGIGGRSREGVFDMLGREGLLGTGAAKGVAEDVAWQTERGITDLIRWGEQWKYQQEQDTMNQLLQYLFSIMGAWR